MAQAHPEWQGKWTLMMAATGSAVGLGNIWKFPYITGEYGGAAFVLIYILFVLFLGVPLMLGELAVGRRSRLSPFSAISDLVQKKGLPHFMRWSGVIPHIGSITILTFYSVIAGWALLYVGYALGGSFSGIEVEQTDAIFEGLLGDAGLMLVGHTLFMIITGVIIARGAVAGIAKSINWLMPLLFIMVAVLMVYSMFSGEFMQAVTYLFTPDFSKINAEAIGVAMGHAFFSLSLGMGSLMVYGSYMNKQESIPVTGTTVSLLDMLLALGMGLVVFPVVFAYGLAPEAGPGLIFKSVPLAMGGLPLGDIFCVVFFVLVAFAALSSSISLLEPTVAVLEERTPMSRKLSTVVVGGGCWLIGIAAALSFNHWSEFDLLGDKNIFNSLDYLATHIFLPLGGLATSMWAGWWLGREELYEQLPLPTIFFGIWQVTVRYVAPILLLLVMLMGLGIVQI